jgi:class 3 adenylate cyclase
MSDFFDRLAGILSSIGPTGTALAIAAVPVAAGVAAYVTRMGTQAKIDRLESDLKGLEGNKKEELSRLEERYADLDRRYQTLLQRGAAVQLQVQTMAAEMEEIADQIDASDYSVLVPAPTTIPGDAPDQLIFLCVSGPQSAKLQWVRVPIATSLSGQVYLSGQATIASPPASGTAYASRTDKVTSYTTTETLSVCLRHKNQRVGVAQFLNKRKGRFDADDTERAVALCAGLALRVSDFIADPRRLAELGHTPRKNRITATIMFMDLSSYSRLFDALDASVITDLLNQYFHELCTIAFRHGASIDQSMGDGALLVFNIDQNLDEHEKAAFRAASEMLRAFQNLRQRWVTLGYAGTETVFVRFGLARGAVTRAELGHVQSRRMTVIGSAVNAAAYACDSGPRDHDTICVTQDFRDALANRVPGFTARPVGTTGQGEEIFETPPMRS